MLHLIFPKTLMLLRPCIANKVDFLTAVVSQRNSDVMDGCENVQVTYIMDAMRFRSCAMGAIWITLGLVNLSMMVSEASFGGLSPLPLAALVSLLSGALLFLVGEAPARLPKGLPSRAWPACLGCICNICIWTSLRHA